MLSRNSRCPCDSGKRYKRCCMGKKEVSEDWFLDGLNRSFRNKIKNGDMWNKMVAVMGEDEAKKALEQMAIIDSGSQVPEGNVVL